MAEFERVSHEVVLRLATGEFRTPCDDVVESMARELIAQRAAKKYRGHSMKCLANVCSDDWKCTCGFDALPEYLKGGE